MKLTRFNGGRFAAPSSKSEAQRALVCAALADAPTEIVCPDASRDIALMAEALRILGATVTRTAAGFSVTPLTQPPKEVRLDCGESGAVLRFLLPVVGALGVSAELHRSGRLTERPITPLTELMQTHGCRFSAPSPEILRCSGRLRGKDYAISGAVSSQFVSGLLLALPLMGHEINLTLLPPTVSADYITLTRKILTRFGVVWEETANGFFLPDGQRCHAQREAVAVGGDWSGAAVWLCAGAISRPVTVSGLDIASAQPDRCILELLTRFGAEVTVQNGTISVAAGRLRGIEAALDGCPDLLPPLTAVAAAAEGVTRFSGIGRLRWKESDRPAALTALLRRLGGRATVEGDTLAVFGGRRLHGGAVSACGDHRIAMAAALLSCLCAEPLLLSGAESVEKSYPQFWKQWEGAK